MENGNVKPMRFGIATFPLSLALAPGTAMGEAPPVAAPERGAQRIVSLIPSLTEDLFAIGAAPRVVGVSQYTDRPARAMRLPQVGSYSALDTEALARLHPDLVVGIPAQATLVVDARRIGLRVGRIPDEPFDDLYATFARLGKLCARVRHRS